MEHRTPPSLLLAYVDHHDAAYRSAERYEDPAAPSMPARISPGPQPLGPALSVAAYRVRQAWVERVMPRVSSACRMRAAAQA